MVGDVDYLIEDLLPSVLLKALDCHIFDGLLLPTLSGVTSSHGRYQPCRRWSTCPCRSLRRCESCSYLNVCWIVQLKFKCGRIRSGKFLYNDQRSQLNNSLSTQICSSNQSAIPKRFTMQYIESFSHLIVIFPSIVEFQ